MDDEQILGLARDLRVVLPDLVADTDQCDKLRGAIAAAERGELPALDLLRYLAQHPEARRWLQDQTVDANRTLGFNSAKAPFTPLAGDGSAIATQEFVCPEPGCTHPSWFRQRIGQTPPECQIHHKRLIPKA